MNENKKVSDAEMDCSRARSRLSTYLANDDILVPRFEAFGCFHGNFVGFGWHCVGKLMRIVKEVQIVCCKLL